MKEKNYPECGEKYNPEKYRCENCKIFIIPIKEKAFNFNSVIEEGEKDEDQKGVYVFNNILGIGERPIYLGHANYYTGEINTGGKLLLTNKSLSFQGHIVNLGRTYCEIKLEEIKEVGIGLNLIISQQLRVETEEEEHLFVVYNGKNWIEKINKARENLVDKR